MYGSRHSVLRVTGVDVKWMHTLWVSTAGFMLELVSHAKHLLPERVACIYISDRTAGPVPFVYDAFLQLCVH